MATSTFKTSAHFGQRQTVTELPFTAPNDGFIYIRSNAASSSSAAYDLFELVGNGNVGISNITTVGGTRFASLPMRKGEQLKLDASSNIASRAISFIPIEWGG